MSFLIDEPVIYLITKGEATSANFSTESREIIDIIRLAVEEGVSLIQLREKNLPARLLFDLTGRAAAVTRGSATRLLVNDRVDVAIAANADGVHLTSDSLPTAIIREYFSKGLIIGVSAHTDEEVIDASTHGADFVVFGPTFETPDKGQFLGTSALDKVCKTVRPFPVLALGGIDGTNISSILDAGASGFAAIRALNDPRSLRAICRTLRK